MNHEKRQKLLGQLSKLNLEKPLGVSWETMQRQAAELMSNNRIMTGDPFTAPDTNEPTSVNPRVIFDGNAKII